MGCKWLGQASGLLDVDGRESVGPAQGGRLFMQGRLELGITFLVPPRCCMVR